MISPADHNNFGDRIFTFLKLESIKSKLIEALDNLTEPRIPHPKNKHLKLLDQHLLKAINKQFRRGIFIQFKEKFYCFVRTFLGGNTRCDVDLAGGYVEEGET